jgi:rubrerythrin
MTEELKELILSLESCNYRIGHADASHVTADEDVAERDKLRKKINGLIEELQAEPTAEEVERVAVLWKLLDDIDTAGDMFKPEINDYFRYINHKANERHKYLISDGYTLRTPEESAITGLVNDLWLYECSNCDFTSKTRKIPTAPTCPSCGSSLVSEVAYVSRRQIDIARAALKARDK